MRTPEEFAHDLKDAAMHDLTCAMCAEGIVGLIRKRDAEVAVQVLREAAKDVNCGDDYCLLDQRADGMEDNS